MYVMVMNTDTQFDERNNPNKSSWQVFFII